LLTLRSDFLTLNGCIEVMSWRFDSLVRKISTLNLQNPFLLDADVEFTSGESSLRKLRPLVRSVLREQGSKSPIFLCLVGCFGWAFLFGGSPDYVMVYWMTFGADPTSYPLGKASIIKGSWQRLWARRLLLNSTLLSMQVVAGCFITTILTFKAAEWLQFSFCYEHCGQKTLMIKAIGRFLTTLCNDGRCNDHTIAVGTLWPGRSIA